jgi:TDG/mug DNA glycosylase family protein
LLACRCGVTNLVARGTATAAELDDDELRAGRRRLARKVARYRPRAVAIVGIGAYRVGFDRPKATLGLQPESLAGAHVWVLANTSGLNANHSPADFGRAFAELRRFVQGERDDSPRSAARNRLAER